MKKSKKEKQGKVESKMKKMSQMKRNTKRFAAMVSSAVLLGGMLPMTALSVQAAEDVTTITLYPSDANLQSGLVGGYKADIFAQRGVALEVWAYSDEKTNAILASGELPDLMYVTRDNLDVMIEAGMVLNLEDYLDQMPHVTEKEELQTAMNYAREFESDGTGILYGMPTVVGGKTLEYGITKNMTVINWEYYYGIGCPEVKDQWQLLDVMEEMLKAYPVGDDGVQNQGTYLNAGSDTEYWANINQYLKWCGYEPIELKYLLESDMINAEYKSILEDDSKYKEGLKWYNQAYRRGLLDPDSISTDRQTQKAKVDNGHAMVTSGTLQGYSGYMPIYLDGQKIYQESWNSVYGNKYLLVINAKSKNIDAAVAFMDMLADTDAYFQVVNGPEGDAVWYLDEDGVCRLQQEYIDNYGNGEETVLADGETLALWSTPWVIDDTNMDGSYVGPDGEVRSLKTEKWSEIMDIKYDTDTWKQWREFSGYDFYVNQVMDAGNYYLTSDLDYITNFASTPDDMMKLTIDAIRDVVVNASWKMVYAESDEDFEALWSQMVQDCKDLGAQDIIDWRLADLETAKQTRDSLQE